VVPKDARPLEAVRIALLEQYERLLAHDPGTRLGTDPEDLHQMRVATRRARAFLRAARPLVDGDWVGALRQELGWLGSALGPARDLDVLTEHLRRGVAELGDAGRPARDLLEALERERVDARAAALATLSDPRYFALLALLEDVEMRVPGTGTGATLSELWWQEFKKVRRVFRKLDAKSSDAALHAGRIRVKRARYAAELASHELGAPGEKFVKTAKKLQDVLGEHQDAFVADDRIRAWGKSGGDPPSVELLLEREQARRADARADWPAAWKKLERRASRART
jgi:CHAD domain-containing protein